MEDIVLRVSLVQYDIVWEDKDANLNYVESKIKELAGHTDVVALPEMFSTGFSMNSRDLAEPVQGKTISTLKRWAAEYDIAICGSYIAKEDDNYYNRGFFITPREEYYYDKRHLFRMSNESQSFSAGEKKLIVEHKGFHICLLICYDLRFPVWARNVGNEYDILIYVANWPASRMKVWNALLPARALENMACVCGVNRIGTDGNGLKYTGGSKMINAMGDEVLSLSPAAEQIGTVSVSKNELERFRTKFPVWKDADKFEIKSTVDSK
ncbi:MAG: amidohydrolase [Prevotella sp.]|jgi:predicted amidohydrolase|nr:amidohydrolase [Prevotella sp.]